MAYGVENQIGIGKAQILPRGGSLTDFAQQLNHQVTGDKRYNEYQQRLDQEKKERDEKELYGIIGSQLNPRNFNTLIHDKVRTSTAELAAKLKGGNMGYGDVYMEALNKAGELGGVSDKLNKVDSILAATRNEYEKYDKRLNTPAIEFEARKKILNQLKSGQPIDENYNYFDDALSGMGSDALTDKSDAIFIDLLPEELSDFEGDYTERKLNRSKTFDWQLKAHPGFYDVSQKNNLETPTVITKGVPSGLKDDGGKEIPMLNEEGYGKFILLPSNRKALDTRIEKKYGNIPKNSQQAEVLRRIEAYNYLESKKPPLRTKEKNITSYPPSTTVINFGGTDFTGGGKTTGNELDKIKNEINLPSDDYTGEWTINSSNIPKFTKAVLKSGGIEIGSAPMRLIIENGKIMEIRSVDGKQKIVNRDEMIAAQKNYDKERKGESQEFGVKDEDKPKKRTYKGLDDKGNPIFE